MNPAAILAQALKPYERQMDALRDFAEQTGVSVRAMRDAMKEHPISADHFLRLTAILGVCPITGERVKPQAPGCFDHAGLALFMTARRQALGGLSIREAAARSDIKTVTLGQIEHGRAVNITNTLKACAFLELSPYDFARAPTSRETGTRTPEKHSEGRA